MCYDNKLTEQGKYIINNVAGLLHIFSYDNLKLVFDWNYTSPGIGDLFYRVLIVLRNWFICKTKDNMPAIIDILFKEFLLSFRACM